MTVAMLPVLKTLVRIVLATVLVMGPSSRATVAAQPVGPSSIERHADDPDRLYAEREDVTKALAAANVWGRRLAANAGD